MKMKQPNADQAKNARMQRKYPQEGYHARVAKWCAIEAKQKPDDYTNHCLSHFGFYERRQLNYKERSQR